MLAVGGVAAVSDEVEVSSPVIESNVQVLQYILHVA